MHPILLFLSFGGNTSFYRQQLADYLNVERSVLSNKLSKMQRDGLISCHKNHFELKEATDITV